MQVIVPGNLETVCLYDVNKTAKFFLINKHCARSIRGEKRIDFQSFTHDLKTFWPLEWDFLI